MQNEMNVFDGPDAIRDFLNPGKHPNLPLVELPAKLNPFAADNVRIFAKLMSMLPLGNVKSVPAFNMIREKYRQGNLEGVERIVENSSGNTVSSMALVARQFGIDQTQSYVPSEISWNKLLMLLFFGIEPIVNLEPTNPDETDPQSGVYKAKKDGEEKEAINPGQYYNEDNPESHEQWTAQQIWQQTDGKIDVFCAGLGTTGTVIGNSRFLKSKKGSLQIVGAMRAPDQYVPGVRTEKLLKLVGFDWHKHVDSIENVETTVSYRLSMELSRQGIVVGPSSGLALASLLQYLAGLKQENKIEELRDKQSDDVVCVFLCPDGPIPYLDEYFKYLDSSHFPAIQNEELLLNKP
ncbi:MAG: pyridoxal-phosphate dependent enzyme [Gammaproteobacteria bacterium]|nr:pyridoxal-phosphate dependent enzyme [Gammaproteobacteria bacterium]